MLAGAVYTMALLLSFGTYLALAAEDSRLTHVKQPRTSEYVVTVTETQTVSTETDGFAVPGTQGLIIRGSRLPVAPLRRAG